jgi:hypothetical protein
MLRTPRCFATSQPLEEYSYLSERRLASFFSPPAPVARRPKPRCVSAGLLFARLLPPSLDKRVADFRSAEHDDS